MSLSKKQKLVIIISIVSAFVVGGIFGFLLGKNVDLFSNAFSRKTLYEAKCPIYTNIARPSEDFDSLNSSDLVTAIDPQLFNGIAQILETCRTEIDQEYPGVEYSLTLEKVENTTIFYIVATGEDPEQITRICNRAADLLPIKVASTINGISCKVIERARIPSKPIE